MEKKMVSVYSIIHFLVDFACAIVINSLIYQNVGQDINIFLIVIMYNFLAFAMQLPIGIMEDKINKNSICAGIGCLFVITSFMVMKNGLLPCILAGLGNALFHIGAGIDVLNVSNKKATLPGIFVSTGALGIFLGSKDIIFKSNFRWYIIVILLLSSLMLFYQYGKIKDKVSNLKLKNIKLNKYEYIAVFCIFITVCLRSYLGMILAFEWKKVSYLALLSVLGVVLGKAIGGIIGDKLGNEKISISLIISAILFMFSFNNPLIGIIAILLFNMTMPITLICLSNILDNNKGMAFGLLTLALFVGAVPTFLGQNMLFSKLGLFSVAMVSAIILYIALKNYNKLMILRKEGEEYEKSEKNSA